jgi:hypothetical protein
MKTHEVPEDSWFLCCDSRPGMPQYEAGMQIIQLQYSVILLKRKRTSAFRISFLF